MDIRKRLGKRKLKDIVPGSVSKSEPLWKGPEEDGITFSLLSRFLACRERFRLYVMEGLRPVDQFNHRLEYGNMWHVCEEEAASEVRYFGGELSGVDTTAWEDGLKCYAQQLCHRYPIDQEKIDHWYNVCKVQFPIYVGFWGKHQEKADRTPLFQEQVFSVPYKLPSGRTVRLRGKWDLGELLKGSANREYDGIWLWENKTKGDIREGQIQRQLTFDLQTMLYLIALERFDWREKFDIMSEKSPLSIFKSGGGIKGVIYNVVRRPLSGGRGTIKRKEPTKSNPRGESKADYYERLRIIIEDEPEYYFMRWCIPISPQDIARFKKETLDPILEQLCDWWEWVRLARADDRDPFQDTDGPFGEPEFNTIHWRHPFGVYNPLDEGGSSDLDEYLATGSEVGLTRVDNLFPELE